MLMYAHLISEHNCKKGDSCCIRTGWMLMAFPSAMLCFKHAEGSSWCQRRGNHKQLDIELGLFMWYT
jgi:hypothetical protein